MEPRICPACGQSTQDAEALHCTNCGAALGAGPPPGGSSPSPVPSGQATAGSPPPPPGNSVPFEDTTQPFFQRLFRTIGMAFTDPTALFSNMARGDIGLPLIYGVLLQSVVIVISLVWNMMFGGMAMLGGDMHAEEFAISTTMYIVIMFLSPVLVTLGMFVSTALYHVSLLVLGDGQRGFAVSFRAVAYGGTPNLLGVVPICGGLIGGIWGLILTIAAFKHGHRTDLWRAILAYFLPTIVCCCLIIWLASTFGILAALSGAR
jgi:hypothetical protein